MLKTCAFKFGGKVTSPFLPDQLAKVLNPPSASAVGRGKELYRRFYVTCRAVDTASGGLAPDLRYSKLLASDIRFDVVLDGSLKKGGMVALAHVLDRHKAAAIHSYVIERANNFKTWATENYAGQP